MLLNLKYPLKMIIEDDNRNNRTMDTLEDCVSEIEELKKELTTIVVKSTPAGRERWDTPDKLSGTNLKGRLRKDRYSALLMANDAARRLELQPEEVDYTKIYLSGAGFASRTYAKQERADYKGPMWFTEAIRGYYD